jgi:glutamyl-tRNA reductase
MMTVISQSDIVFTSTAATQPLLNREKLSSVMNPCHRLMIFDISVPRNVDSDVNDLPTIQSYNVDDLKAVVAQNHETRRQMAMEGELLLEEAVLTFEAWWRSLETIPIISSLQEKVETIRTQELEKALSRLGSEFAEKHQDVIEQLTRGIVKKILHDPMVQLRAQQDIEARRRAMESLRILFNLETGSSGHRQFS